jgi:hypothetical protein
MTEFFFSPARTWPGTKNAQVYWQCGVWSGSCKVWGCLIRFGCFVNLWEVEAFFVKI